MMTPVYNATYLSQAAKSVGNMLHDAVIEFGYKGDEFLHMFIQSGIAEEIESGNPKYIAGKSGIELFSEVMERTVGKQIDADVIETYEKSDVYWIGWALTHYQWYSGRSFKDILETVSFDALQGLYDTLHETDVRKFYEVLDAHFAQTGSKLKIVRKDCGLTQEELSGLSGVSINTIRAYERKSKDINKAQAEIVVRLSGALKCEMMDILG